MQIQILPIMRKELNALAVQHAGHNISKLKIYMEAEQKRSVEVAESARQDHLKEQLALKQVNERTAALEAELKCVHDELIAKEREFDEKIAETHRQTKVYELQVYHIMWDLK